VAQLQRANALLSLAMSVSAVAGPTLAGILVALLSPGWGLAADALSFLIAAVALAWLPTLTRVDRSGRPSFVAQLAQGWDEVRSRTWLWVSIAEFGLLQFALLGSLYVLGPTVASEALGGSASWGAILAGFGLGSIGGSLAALRFRPRRPLVAAFLALIGFAPGLSLLAAHAPTMLVAAGLSVGGFAMYFANTLWSNTLQEQIPPGVL
jgi:MFS family permease